MECYKCKERFKKRDGDKCPKCEVRLNSKGGKFIPCPACDKHIGRRKKGGLCPNCGEKLNLVREKKGQLNVISYELASPKLDVPNNLPTPRKDITVKRNSQNEWVVFFRVLTNRVVCPNCKKLAFKPRVNKGRVEHKCDRCKHLTTFVFDIKPRNAPI